MKVTDVTSGQTFPLEERRTETFHEIERIATFVESCLQTGCLVKPTLLTPELEALADTAKQYNRTLFALTPSRVRVLHLAPAAAGFIVADVADADVQDGDTLPLRHGP